jgi:transcriptional regulator with XRE-family HTH domain
MLKGLTMGNMMSIELKTPRDVQRELAARFKARRLAMNLTQEGLAARSGVSWSSLKRFEHTGLISLDALLKLALVLGCLGDFDGVCIEDNQSLSSRSLDELLSKPKTRRKGQIK